MSDIFSAAKKGVSHGVALGADQVEVYVVKQQLTRVSVRKAHVIGGDVVEMGGAGVRVYIDGALGVAATSRLGEIKGAVERAYQLAKGTIGDPDFKSLPGPSGYGTVEGLYDEELANVPFEELTEGFMEGVTAASGDGELTVSGGLTRGIGEVAVVNSLGVECQIRGTSIGGSIGTKAERGEDVAMGRGSIIGRNLREFKPVEAGMEAAEKARARLGARKVSTGTMDLILDFRSARGSIAGVLGTGVNGLSVALGNSFLSDNIEDGGLNARTSSTNISSMVNSGHYIEDGEVVHPVKNTMVGTTVFEFLRNVEGLSREVLLEGGSSSPALKLKEIKVSGGR